jgi:FkbM family methyltransferase
LDRDLRLTLMLDQRTEKRENTLQRHFTAPLYRWMTYSTREKIRRVRRRVLGVPYYLLVIIVRLLPLKTLSSLRWVRKLMFDTADPQTPLLAVGRAEMFLVSPSDKLIARQVYIKREPYDFEKAEWALSAVRQSREVNCLIDVGANIGTICIPATKRGLVASAIAFEPEPENFARLSLNVMLNGVSSKVRLVNRAIGDRDDEQVEFELSTNNFGDHRVRSLAETLPGDGARRTIHVTTQTLDTALVGVDLDHTLLFIDTQGYEGQVLMGGRATLRHRPPMVIEFAPEDLKRQGGFPALKSALISAGYKHFTIVSQPDITRDLTEATLNELHEVLSKDRQFTDLLIV